MTVMNGEGIMTYRLLHIKTRPLLVVGLLAVFGFRTLLAASYHLLATSLRRLVGRLAARHRRKSDLSFCVLGTAQVGTAQGTGVGGGFSLDPGCRPLCGRLLIAMVGLVI